jgi:hypothetical protein
MSKVLLLLSLLVAYETNAFAQSGFEFPVLSGKVKTCTEINFKALEKHDSVIAGSHKKESRAYHNYKIYYDSAGRVTRRDELDIFGDKIFRKHLYSYDENDYLVKKSIVAGWGSSIKEVRYYYQLDDKGRPIRIKTASSDSPDTVTTIYVYEGNHKVSELSQYEGAKESLPYRDFDSSGNVIKQWTYTPGGKLEGSYEMKYDSIGNLIEQKVFDAHGKNYVTYSWRYLSGHDPERYEIHQPGSNNFESWSYKYEYDSHHNWIRCVEYRNGKPVFVKEREIIYF